MIAGVTACSGGGDESGGGSSSFSGPTVAANAALVSWSAPTTTADGAPLGNLEGFKVYYGTVPGDYTDSITVTDTSARSLTVNGLAPGTYYFAVTAYDSDQYESSHSDEVSKTIR